MAKKIKKYKVGLNSETYAISLVESPAIEENFVALAKEEEVVDVKLSDDEKHIVYGAVLVPEKDIYRNNGENEYYINFSEESIEKMSQDFMREYRQYEIKTDHDKIADEVCVVESWIKTSMTMDKSVALGLNPDLPIGTWFCGCKVNNIETWKRIKDGELRGFSVESLINLEEFSKNDNNMEIKTDEMFFDKIKNVLKEVLASVSMTKQEEETKIEPIEPIAMEDLAEETPAPTETPTEAPKVEESPTEEPIPEPTEAPKAEEPIETPQEPKEEAVEPQNEPNDNAKHLEELINNLKEEINALKEANGGLKKQIKNLEKQPSAAPVNTNAKVGVQGDNYSAWREVMRGYLG